MNCISFNQKYRWYAVYTKSRAEKKVHAELICKGIEAYLPLKKEYRQWSDRIKLIEEPLLRGYLFVKVSNREYYDVLVTSGALRYVSFEGRPTAIPDCQIDDLKQFLEMSNESVEVTSKYIRKGDQVKVVLGPLKGVCGEVIEVRGKERLLLRFDSLGYFIHVELGMNKVEMINQKKNKPLYQIG